MASTWILISLNLFKYFLNLFLSLFPHDLNEGPPPFTSGS